MRDADSGEILAERPVDLLDRDPEAQARAVWAFLSQGGAMALPRAAPRPCAPSIVATSTPMASAVATCRSLKSALEAVAEPVTNVPRAPTKGASSGQAPPSASAAAAAARSGQETSRILLPYQ